MALPIIILWTIVAYLLNGVALKLLWGWFMVPTFNLPALSLAQAIGVSIVISFLTAQHIPRDENDKFELMFYGLAIPVLAIIIGWIVHLFL